MCCDYGNGNVSISVDDEIVYNASDFGGSSEFKRCLSDSSCMKLMFVEDQYPSEQEWTLKINGVEEFSGDGTTATYTKNCGFSSPSPPPHPPPSPPPCQHKEYVFNITDAYGDGMCCNYGNGYYSILLNDAVLHTGSDFGASDSYTLCAPPGDCVELRFEQDNFPAEQLWYMVSDGTVLGTGNGASNSYFYNNCSSTQTVARQSRIPTNHYLKPPKDKKSKFRPKKMLFDSNWYL